MTTCSDEAWHTLWNAANGKSDTVQVKLSDIASVLECADVRNWSNVMTHHGHLIVTVGRKNADCSRLVLFDFLNNHGRTCGKMGTP